MNKDGPVVKVKVTPKQLHSMIHKRQARLPLGYQVAKGGKFDAYCDQKSALHQFVIKNFTIKNNHILVKFTS
ncbi:hypothetical protein [Bacillus subtilis]|uniref:hypothetical protein n=1 Tax=Bacillus subtilis TaxID=1423 RepID=UPI002DBFFE8E|nr:hypothetical protein [Bacillus subtilis]MEC0285506.1 hypothetical protein [Bacillus subtilis]MEC0481469.1 hypothetical protein [Bacillus subtilis]MEC0522187.1 hypothetical protein [Bacillus subtilis]